MTEKRRITGILLTGAVYLAAALCLAVLVGIIGYVVIKGLPADQLEADHRCAQCNQGHAGDSAVSA